jgi:hypothetical protein
LFGERMVLSMSSNRKSAIGVTIAAVVVFAAAFLPWGRFSDESILLPGMETFFEMSQGMEKWTMTGWRGGFTVQVCFGLTPICHAVLPNWLVVVAAASVAALYWLKAVSAWDAPLAVLFALAGYGLLYVGFWFVALMAYDKGDAGVGSFLTALGFAGILVILVQQVRTPKTASAPNQPLQPTGPA